MDTRKKISALLIVLGLMLALLPLSSRGLTGRPQSVLREVLGNDSYVTVDQVARYIASGEKEIGLIDLRTPEEFNSFSIPGAVNVPFSRFFDKDPDRVFNTGSEKYVLYSNGDVYSSYAFVLAKGLGCDNVSIMKGGLNEWCNTVMNSTFTGDRITARENAIFEARTKARKLFTEINSLPDSLKQKYLESRLTEAKKLDGGCE